MSKSITTLLPDLLIKDFPAKYAYKHGIDLDISNFVKLTTELDDKLKFIGVKYAFIDENNKNVASNQRWKDINVLLNKYIETLEPSEEMMDKFYDIIERYEEENINVNRFTLANLLVNVDPSIRSIFSNLQESFNPENLQEIKMKRNAVSDVVINDSKTLTDNTYKEESRVPTDVAEEALIYFEKSIPDSALSKQGNVMLLENISQKVGDLKQLIDNLVSNPPEDFEFDEIRVKDSERSMGWMVDKENAEQIKFINQFIEEYIKNTVGDKSDPEITRVRKLCLDIKQKQKEVNKLATSLTELNKKFIWHMIKRQSGGVDIGKSNDLIHEKPFGNTLLTYDDIYSVAYLQFYNSIFSKATSGPLKDYTLLTYAGNQLKSLITEISQNASLIKLSPDEIDRQRKLKYCERELLQKYPSNQKNSDEYYDILIKAMQSKIAKVKRYAAVTVDREYVEKIQKNRELAKIDSIDAKKRSDINTDDDEFYMNGNLFDEIAYENGESAEDYVDHQLLRDKLIKTMADLSDRERETLVLRYGLEDGVEHTLSDIGQKLEVGRERARQIESKAMHKMRHPNRKSGLRDFL
jgi:RNA polymerase sigma factor (sigma-70 family)